MVNMININVQPTIFGPAIIIEYVCRSLFFISSIKRQKFSFVQPFEKYTFHLTFGSGSSEQNSSILTKQYVKANGM